MVNRYLYSISLFALSIGAQSTYCQIVQGNIKYAWQEPTAVFFSGNYKPVVTLGDEISLSINGDIDLRPREVEKKRGGFFGIGAKRYKVIDHDWHKANQVNIYTGISGTNYWKMEKNSNRQISITRALIPFGTTFAESMKGEYNLLCYIAEPGKVLRLGSANVTISMKIETRNRIGLLIDFVKSHNLNSFKDLRDIIEKGNLLKQYPSELADTLTRYYQKYKPMELAKFETDFYEYLLQKAPENANIRSSLAGTYLRNERFVKAEKESAEVIRRFENPGVGEVKPDSISVGIAYRNLGEVAERTQLAMQRNAGEVAVAFYDKAMGFLKNTSTVDFLQAARFKVKALQRLGDESALLEAIGVLEGLKKENS